MLISGTTVFAQFGKNRVQYRDYEWYYIQTEHFDIYFTPETETAAEFTANASEEALEDLMKRLDYRINSRITLIVYNSHNAFQETNTIDAFVGQGTGGFTELFKNRVVFPFEGDYKKFRHVIHHELVHAVMNDMLYGGSIQNIISKGITLQLPLWYSEGMAEYLSSGWETNSDMFIRDAIMNEYLPDIPGLGGYFAYRGGQAVFKYIADKYGDQKVGDLLQRVKSSNGLNGGLKSSIGLSLEELNERWKKELKKTYWPDIDDMKDPDEFAKRLTDNKEVGGFYNTSPVISPQGDKIVFISDRDVFLDIYVMSAFDGKVIDEVVETGQTNNFEALNVLFPALTWAPDNDRIALSVKSSGYDVVKIINTKTGDTEEIASDEFVGVGTVNWSPDGKKIAIIGNNTKQSDIYVYNFDTKEITNYTNDIFTEEYPVWSPDSKYLIFSSDRGENLNEAKIIDGYGMYNHYYYQNDLYILDEDTKKVRKLTDWKFSDEESVVFSPEGNQILFSSDKSGITNIYKADLNISKSGSSFDASLSTPKPITNSLNGLDQLSISKDGSKLTFTTLFKGGYNIFLIDNPFDIKPVADELPKTEFMENLIKKYEDKDLEEIVVYDMDVITFSEQTENFMAENENPVSDVTVNKDSTDTSEEKESQTPEEKPENSEKENKSNNKIFTGQYVNKSSEPDSTAQYKNYVFGQEEIKPSAADRVVDDSELFEEKLDEEGNYLVNRYKITFTPDLVYANAGYSSLYGLLGTTVLSFSDVLGDHRLVGVTSLQLDVKNSDYGLAYYNLKDRIDWGVEGFHTARFVYLSNNFQSELHRFRNYGAVISASYPFSTFRRLDFGMSYLNVSSENLDNLNDSPEKVSYFIPSVSFVYDNSLFGYTAPIQGTRYNITLFGSPGLWESRNSFFSLTWDMRKYFRFWYDNSFAIRLSGGYSGGANPQRFFLGGTASWLNRTFRTGDIPLEDASDFAFLSPAMPMRGFDYAEQIGTKYSLVNIELRMPLIRYLVTGPLPLLLQNIQGVVFVDAGAAWDENKQLRLFTSDANGNPVTDDLLLSMGAGWRLAFLTLWKFDFAWKFDGNKFSEPRFLVSIGTDF